MEEWGDISSDWESDVYYVERHEPSDKVIDYSDSQQLNVVMRYDVVDSINFVIPEKNEAVFLLTTKAISLLDVVNYIEQKKGAISEAIIFFYTINDKAANYTCALAKRANLKVVISDLMNSQRLKERVITKIFDDNNVEIVFCHNHAKICAINIDDNNYVLSGSMNAGNNARIENLQIVNSKENYDFILKAYETMRTKFRINKRYKK